MLIHKTFLHIPYKLHSLITILFLFILGSHLLDYHPLFFIVVSIILIDWRKIYLKEVLVLFIFLTSVYITLLFLDRDIIHNFDKAMKFLSQALMLFLAYLFGLSIRKFSKSKTFKNDKFIFYIFFGFFIAYTISLLYSYIVLPEDNPITREGMYVCFQNEYKRLNVNGGNLISTVIAYYLTFTVILLPFILLYFKEFRARKFSHLELLFLVGCSFFTLYLASEMGRRTVLFLLLLTFLYLGISIIINKFKAHNYYHILLVVISIILLIILGYYFFADTMAVKRLISLDITQVKRFQFWTPGLQAMMDHPFGGGHDVIVGQNGKGFNMKLAHNTWIDIGKDFGIIPFVAFIIFFLIHMLYIIRVFLSKTINSLTKHLFVVIFVCFFAIMMIEPVFTSDKTFFFYIIFYLGFLKNYSDCIKSHENQQFVA